MNVSKQKQSKGIMTNFNSSFSAFFYGFRNMVKSWFTKSLSSSLNYDYNKLNQILKDELCPCAFVDLDVFDQNLDWLGEQVEKSGKTIRIGTKSLRVPGLIKRALDRPFMQGLFIYHPNEIKYWQEQYGESDFLLAYPVMSKPDIDILCEAIVRDPNTKIHVMADSEYHLELLNERARHFNVTLGVIADCDFGITFLGQVAGVLRSPLQTSDQVLRFVKKIPNYPNLEFRGIMGYEAQEAGIGDKSPIYTLMKYKSRLQNNKFRQNVVKKLTEAGFPPQIVNGGGSGCFQETLAESPVTEATVGSGLFKSYIFDSIESMNGFHPSMFMALRIVRFPRPNVATCFSGGYVCSATNLPPKIILPSKCNVTKREGFGEVQTPVKYNPNQINFDPGDIIICRLAKAGEPMEWFANVVAISEGTIVKRYPTYRTLGVWGG